MPPQRSCSCDSCKKCLARIAAKERYDAMSVDERRALVARRDKEKIRPRDRARQRGNVAHQARVKAYHQTAAGKEAHNRGTKSWRQRNPEKYRAHTIVSNAVRDGKLARPQECEVDGCAAKPQAHHADYAKPLEVRWICARHHIELHVADRGLDVAS